MKRRGVVVGGAQTLSKMRSRFPGAYPRSIVRGLGASVMDADGGWYVDWICGLGAISLGYAHPAVDRAVRAQVDDGPLFPLANESLEQAVVDRLADLVPCAEAIRFVKTGSEATEAAIRVARAYTGRDVVLKPRTSYHGWHSWSVAARPEHPGVPDVMSCLVRQFDYNDLDSLDEAVEWAKVASTYTDNYICDGVAAIILEPTLFELPAPGFLEGVRERATRCGAVLIFDEAVTGFRWHPGGYQALCGVTPDLATFGKALANGYPMAALVGRVDVMEHARLVSGTFGGDCVGLAAALATTGVYQRNDVCGHMREVGETLIGAYNDIAKARSVPTRMVGQAPHPRIEWDEVGQSEAGSVPGAYEVGRKYANRHRASLFFQECVRRGVLFHPDGINVTFAHGPYEVEQTIGACDAAAQVVARAIEAGTVKAQIEGSSISPEPPWRNTR